jgi:hypothetical protein
MAGTQVPVSPAAVAVRGTEFDADQVEFSVPHSALRDDGIGKLPHLLHRALQQGSFDALLVVEVGMHRRDGEVVVGVLDRCEPLGQLPFMMVVDVGKVCDVRSTSRTASLRLA